MLALRSLHGDARGYSHIHADLGGIIQPDSVFNDLCIQSCFAKFLRHVFCGGFVLGRPGDVRSLGQDAQVLLGELRIGYGKETLFGFLLAGHVAKSRDRDFF